jgi:hypothetical protein
VGSDLTLYIDPPSYHFERDRLFDLATAPSSGDSILAPYVELRARLARHGIDVHTADLLDGQPRGERRNLYVSTGITKRFRRFAERGDVVLSAFFVFECPVAAPKMFARLHEASRLFARMFAFNDGASLTPFMKGPVRFETLRYTYPFDGIDEPAWSATHQGFLTMINANKSGPIKDHELYSERLRAIEFFARQNELDLYGIGWDGPPFRIGRGAWIPGRVRRLGRRAEHSLGRLRPDARMRAARSAWRGPVAVKAAVLAGYRFSICIENQLLDGWITEKLLDCLRAGCVPIYLGAPDVARWIPPECFIDLRAFDGYEELREYLHSIGEAEVQAFREAGRDFLGSDRFRPFSKQAFADVFARIIREDAGVELPDEPAAEAQGRPAEPSDAGACVR